MSRRTWGEAARYVVPLAAVGTALLPFRWRTGIAVLGLATGVGLFFRDPERPLDPEPGLVYSAADGFVTAVEPVVEDPWFPEGKAMRIQTFLSVHNVHVNRSPVAGEVADLEAIPGGFAPALFGRAGDNSRNRIALDTPKGRVVVVQVAGSIARTIACWVERGEQVVPGQRLGMIHFGSRTDILLPVDSADPLVVVGDRVRAGVTPMARYR